MGMLGAMAGLGKGMQDFSTLLNEKAKMDWQSQRDQVLWERQENLAKLQNTWANERQENQQGFLQKQADDAALLNVQNAQIAELDKTSDQSLKEKHDWEVAGFNRETSMMQISAQKSAQIDVAKQLANFADTKDETKRAKQLAALEKNEDFIALKESDPTLAKIVRMKADPLMEPMAQALLASYAKGGTEFTGRDLVAFQKNSSEKWQALGSDGQKTLAEQLNAQEAQLAKDEKRKPQPLGMEQVESLFHANEFKKLKDFSGRSKGMLGSPGATATTKPGTIVETTPGVVRYSPEDIPVMAKLIVAKKGTLEEAKARMAPDQYIALENQVEALEDSKRQPIPVGQVDAETLSPATLGMLNAKTATKYDYPIIGDYARQQDAVSNYYSKKK
jgi:hypothetical protein